ncbi:MAG: hypothetical protein AAGA35_01890 [Patescibacteria group bacterium]
MLTDAVQAHLTNHPDATLQEIGAVIMEASRNEQITICSINPPAHGHMSVRVCGEVDPRWISIQKKAGPD